MKFALTRGVLVHYDDNQSSTQKLSDAAGEAKVVWPVIHTQAELFKTAETQSKGGRIYALQGKKLGEILNSLAVIDDETLKAIERHHDTFKDKGKGKLIGQLLVQLKEITEQELIRALCIQSGIPMIELSTINIPRDTLSLIPNERAKASKVIPVGIYNKSLYLAVSDPTSFTEKQYFSFLTKLNIKPIFSPVSEILVSLKEKWNGDGSYVWVG